MMILLEHFGLIDQSTVVENINITEDFQIAAILASFYVYLPFGAASDFGPDEYLTLAEIRQGKWKDGVHAQAAYFPASSFLRIASNSGTGQANLHKKVVPWTHRSPQLLRVRLRVEADGSRQITIRKVEGSVETLVASVVSTAQLLNRAAPGAWRVALGNRADDDKRSADAHPDTRYAALQVQILREGEDPAPDLPYTGQLDHLLEPSAPEPEPERPTPPSAAKVADHIRYEAMMRYAAVTEDVEEATAADRVIMGYLAAHHGD